MGDNSLIMLLSVIVFLPVLGAIVLAFIPGDQKETCRYLTLGVTLAVLVASIFAFFLPSSPASFDLQIGAMQSAFNVPWIPSFDIGYFFGIDGISFPLIMLTGVVSVLAMGASWSIEKHVKAYCILFLLLLTGMLGVFMALDFFLFYVFWEVMLLPMYFLIGVWGGPRKEYAAIKFFLYTLVGSVLMLIAILMLYFNSDLRVIADKHMAGKLNVAWQDLHLGSNVETKLGVATTKPQGHANAAITVMRKDTGAASQQPLELHFAAAEGTAPIASFNAAKNLVEVKLAAAGSKASEVVKAIAENVEIAKVLSAQLASGSDGSEFVNAEDDLVLPAYQAGKPIHTFNILALSAIGQNTDLFTKNKLLFGQTLQWWAFLLLFVGFIIKVPSVPLHTWLPDAHVEAPTPISMILAGVLLKMGGYGIVRICYPICPQGGYELAYFVCLLGVVSMVYGGFAALAQKDFKRMVAYSSVSHMGYVVLGLGVWSATGDNAYNWEYWNMGIKGALFQMIGHGISSPGMFFMVGIIYDRVHHRNLEEFGGLFGKMPVYTAMAMGLFFAGLGLPGLCGFIGEVFVVLSVWKYNYTFAIVSAFVVIITAAYILWAIQRVYLGAEYKGPHGDHLHPSTLRENLIGGILLVLSVIFGVFPYQTVLKYMDATVDRQTQLLTNWTMQYEAEETEKAAAKKTAPQQAELNRVPEPAVTTTIENKVVVAD
jgi:NADH-quinone oxidoreductase subunit M